MRNALSIGSIRIAAALLLAGGVASWSAVAEPAPATEEHYLDIPGIGRVPIPLPPGSRVYGPRGGERPPSPPAADLREEAPRREGGLDQLFVRLAEARSEEEASALEQAIGRVWARSGSATADLLFRRAAQAIEAGAPRLALDLLDHVVTLEPGWPQALVGRAEARLALGDAAGAERDLEAAVRLDPRRFDALGAMGVLREQAGAPARALDAYRRAIALDPRRADWRKAKDRLEPEVDGRDI